MAVTFDLEPETETTGGNGDSSAPDRRAMFGAANRAKSVVLTPEKKLTALMLKCLIFLDGLMING